jgi:sulfatase maturation enzyme AslB (radical SAM superfamily)
MRNGKNQKIMKILSQEDQTEHLNIPFFSQTNLNQSQQNLIKHYLHCDLTVSGFPKYLVIEPTNRCNLNCIMCPRGEMTRSQGFMDFELLKNNR